MKNIQLIIQNMCKAGGFQAAVLTDAAGFPLAASRAGTVAEAPAAVVAAMMRMAEQAREHVGMTAMAEVTMLDDRGRQLICQRFTAGGRTLYLAVKAPPQVSYRETMGQAVSAIQAAWAYKASGRKPDVQEA